MSMGVDPFRTDAQSFVRLEDKYLLPHDLLTELTDLFAKRATEAGDKAKLENYRIESVYYDSSQLNIFQDHFQLLRRRSKIRVRSYFNDQGARKRNYHLELKVKENNISSKERLKIGESDVALLNGGQAIPLTPKLLERNAEIPAELLESRLEKINTEFARYDMKASCSVSYERHAYEEQDFRMTYDEGLCFRWLQNVLPATATKLQRASFWNRAEEMRRAFLQRNNLVVELKHRGQIPEWLQAFFVDHPYPRVSFSKYCYAVAQSLHQGARP